MSDDCMDWDDERQEMQLCCGEEGLVTAADRVALRRLPGCISKSFHDFVAEGGREKAQRMLREAQGGLVRDVELPMLIGGKVATLSFCAKPAADGRGVTLLGTRLPASAERALQELQDAFAEIVELNREVARQKRALEAKTAALVRKNRELDESNRGVRALHTELEDKAASLKRAADVKGRVVANVSHEFRTPLHTILGLSKILLNGVDGALSSEQEKQIRYIRSSAEELQQVVNDLLDLSKNESGKAQLRPERFDAEQLLATLRGQMRPLADPRPGVELVFEPLLGEVELETDLGKVAQILRNLISNALKFTECGEVRVQAKRVGTRLRVSVRDTGIGIAEHDYDLVFEEFGQVESELQKKVRGTGLGLPLSKRMAELLGGDLVLESALGEGSTFTLEVPLVHPEVSELARIQARPLDASKAPVLVVEDDRKTIFVYEKYLSMTGFQVLPARTIEQARQLVRSQRPTAIVLDVMLEGETSWAFLAELKSDPETSDIPVLVVTVTSKAQKARALGADEFWLKPLDQGRLIKKLKSLSQPGEPAEVLVIDDDEKARYLLRKLLEDTPYDLAEAADGMEGVKIAQQHRPGLIFLDFLLEDMTAFDVLDELKADPRTRGIPVIIVTSQVLEEEARNRLAAETEAILSKESLSREIAINRIRDALSKAGIGSNAQ